MTSFWNNARLILAPLDGVTDFVFREIVAETAKPDVLFTEFTNTDALFSRGREKTLERFKFSEIQRPIVAQIWGTKPENFFRTAELVRELGFDGIDINMGCPDRAVMKLGAGAGLIDNPMLAAELIAATKEGAEGIPVSVKTRIGVNSIVTESWIGFLLQQKIAALTIHGRTAEELSKVPTHWDEIGKAVEIRNEIAPETILVGNGGVETQQAAEQMREQFGVDAVMIGKGIFSNPWIFENLPQEHSTNEYLELLLKHTKLYCDTYPDKKRFSAMKKFFKNYVKGFRGADNMRENLMSTSNYDQVLELVGPFILPARQSQDI